LNLGAQNGTRTCLPPRDRGRRGLSHPQPRRPTRPHGQSIGAVQQLWTMPVDTGRPWPMAGYCRVLPPGLPEPGRSEIPPGRHDDRNAQHSWNLPHASFIIPGRSSAHAKRDPTADGRGWGASTRSILAAETISPVPRDSTGNPAAQPAYW